MLLLFLSIESNLSRIEISSSWEETIDHRSKLDESIFYLIILSRILADWICLIFRDLSNIIEQNWFNKFIHQNLVCFDRVYICQFKFPIIEIIKSHVLSLFVTKFAE